MGCLNSKLCIELVLKGQWIQWKHQRRSLQLRLGWVSVSLHLFFIKTHWLFGARCFSINVSMTTKSCNFRHRVLQHNFFEPSIFPLIIPAHLVGFMMLVIGSNPGSVFDRTQHLFRSSASKDLLRRRAFTKRDQDWKAQTNFVKKYLWHPKIPRKVFLRLCSINLTKLQHRKK